jgi:signal peptidase II
MFNKPIYKNPIILIILLISFSFDQISKTLVSNFLLLGESIPDDGFFRITHIGNSGTIWGLFPEQTIALTIGSFLGIGLLYYLYYKIPSSSPLVSISIGLQLGGALGNLIDRIRLGYVVDFIDIGAWPIFNLADSCIVTGIVMLVFILICQNTSEVSPSEESQSNTIK